MQRSMCVIVCGRVQYLAIGRSDARQAEKETLTYIDRTSASTTHCLTKTTHHSTALSKVDVLISDHG